MKKVVACRYERMDLADGNPGVPDAVLEFQERHPGADIEVQHNAYAAGPWHYVSLVLIARQEVPDA